MNIDQSTLNQRSQKVTILGATGTIGLQTLDVISQHPAKFEAFALTANANDEALYELCVKHRPVFAVLLQEAACLRLIQKLSKAGINTKVLCGEQALCEMASHDDVDIVMAAIVGSAGLLSSMAAAEAGKKVLLANKETLVMAGRLFMQAVKKGGATLLPIDSEHNAIFQVMPTQLSDDLQSSGIKKILLTASGGPFRNASLETLHGVTKAQALHHPNWVMGPKITIDSATLMNKGLEVIEAHWLFNASADEIDVVVHPQSIIHSMVEYHDGSVLAQLGNPDMRTPIAYGLAYPDRITSGVNSLDFLTLAKLEFSSPDLERFPCLRLAYDALRKGGTAPAILNAANEIAVQAFLDDKIQFLQIPKVIETVLLESAIEEVTSIEQLIEVDRQARLSAETIIQKKMQ
jgi:1-deoxy-D-xylulose-5-phosphate reductoisomerase